MMNARVLCVVVPGFEEIEMICPVDLLRRAGVEVVMASLEAGPVTGRCGVMVVADAVLGDVMGEVFDLLLLPGGPGVGEMRRDGRAGRLAKEFVEAGKLVAAICAAPLVLMDAGLFDGRRFTAHDSTAGELPGSSGERVEEDGGLITSRGAGTALDFGFLLVRKLAGVEVEEEIRRSIMV